MTALSPLAYRFLLVVLVILGQGYLKGAFMTYLGEWLRQMFACSTGAGNEDFVSGNYRNYIL